MTSRAALAAVLMVLAQNARAECSNEAHSRRPLEGGVVAETKDADFELVARPDALYLYVRGHGRSIDLLGADAQVTLVAGKSKQVVALHPASSRFEATGAFKVGAGTRAVAVVTTSAGKTRVRFALK